LLIGDKGEAMLEYFEGPDGMRQWGSGDIGPGAWTTIHIDLPAVAGLRRVDVYSCYASGAECMTGLRLRRGGTLLGQILGSGPLANEAFIFGASQPGDQFDLEVRAGSEGRVVLRAIRMFIDMAGETVEVYPASEPKVVAVTTGTHAGDVAAITGSLQRVRSYAEGFDATSSWHSTQVAPGAWLSLDVEFPEPVQLGHVKVHTGHSGYYHAARTVQIERECACTAGLSGSRDACSGASAAACASGGPMVFEYVDREDSSPDHLVAFPPHEARVWRIAMRTPTAQEQPITPGYINVRGVRFFDAAGTELAPARIVAPGI
jgi:hypothetical protein